MHQGIFLPESLSVQTLLWCQHMCSKEFFSQSQLSVQTLLRCPHVCSKEFFSQSHFQCRLSYGVRTPLCAITSIDICAHVKDPVVHVRVGWSMETLEHPACTTVQVARLCQKVGLPRGRQPEFPMGEITLGQYSCKKFFFFFFLKYIKEYTQQYNKGLDEV